ncbi:MAG: hypothetical protein AAF934_05765 [Bacteroidota bacterium]
MASDSIIMDDDEVEFLPNFGSAIVTVKPGKIEASGKTTINNKNICVKGDEKSVAVSGCDYISGPFVGGKGTLKIKRLVSNQLTKKAKSGGKSIILKGKPFIAHFEVTSPAKQPPPANTPDPVPIYIGLGKFKPNNEKIKAT